MTLPLIQRGARHASPDRANTRERRLDGVILEQRADAERVVCHAGHNALYRHDLDVLLRAATTAADVALMAHPCRAPPVAAARLKPGHPRVVLGDLRRVHHLLPDLRARRLDRDRLWSAKRRRLHGRVPLRARPRRAGRVGVASTSVWSVARSASRSPRLSLI